MLFDNLGVMLLATNTGSLFQLSTDSGNVLAFASERFILQRVLDEKELSRQLGDVRLEQIRAGHALAIQLDGMRRRAFSLLPDRDEPPLGDTPNGHHVTIVDHSSRTDRLRRCTKCILPETFPFVGFDEHGVCAYCREWKTIQPKGHEELLKAVEPYRSKDGSPDVIVAFSGGRDSSYGLHYVKKVLGMNPIAFTYDWGMVTDLARRNCARVCGKLGVEHIIRSADITAKRRYVRKNIEAWLKKPELGMVTLFMAGDKEFYAHARQLRKETGIKLVIFCTGNLIEEARYKVGFMGVPQDDDNMVLPNMSVRNKAAMLWYFAKNYAKNPAYVNESILDTANAFWQTFVVKDDFLYLYHYVPWTEDEIVGTIRREYDWEVATDTTTTWRIGDGTAAFYNYIYLTIAGFTEDESMLANMVREGHLTRDEAIKRAAEYSKPRWDSLREYAQLIGFSFEEAMQAINAAPKLF
jgi:glucosamine--fructose-6-phosphate aminotransferase (isomerizing)